MLTLIFNKLIKGLSIFLNYFLEFGCFMLVGYMIYNFSMRLMPLTYEKTKLYSYSTLPSQVKHMLVEFEQEAKSRKIDVSRLTKIHYILLDDPKNISGNFASSTLNLIVVTNADMNNGHKEILWHELGHLLFNYGHDENDNNDNIMNASIGIASISWAQQKDNYFTKPTSRNYWKNTITGYKLWIEPGLIKNYYAVKFKLHFWVSSLTNYIHQFKNQTEMAKVAQNEKTN